MIINYLLVALGGMCGSLCRYALSCNLVKITSTALFPWPTFIVNILGCLLIGLFSGWIERANIYNSELRLLLITGLLGGFTTFSALSIESLQLLKQGHYPTLFIYISSSIILGILASHIGISSSV